jgi:2-polyprenyl-3-methyl-5-hydroxy-6-metoxy-1,4-benzoquinol methylase
MQQLLPDRLKGLWQCVVANQLTSEEYTSEHERMLAEYRDTWKHALLFDGHEDLQASILSELSRNTACDDMAEIQRRCTQALADVKSEWQEKVKAIDRQSVERFYDESQAMIYELMEWHTLCDDSSPLAYVTALHFARQQGCRHYLDFGAGVGSGAILFARHGLQVALADISSSLLRFSQWRINTRGLSAQYFDLKTCALPRHTFDLVTAMDVFEHLVDPVQTVDHLSEALKPGGFLFARLAAEADEDRPQHIHAEFGPTLERLRVLGFVEVWRDEWLWGHQVFQKSCDAR